MSLATRALLVAIAITATGVFLFAVGEVGLAGLFAFAVAALVAQEALWLLWSLYAGYQFWLEHEAGEANDQVSRD